MPELFTITLITNYLTSEMADRGLRPLTSDLRDYLRAVFLLHLTDGERNGVWQSASVDARLHAALVKRGFLVDGQRRVLTPFGERNCAVLFRSLTPEGQAFRQREMRLHSFNVAMQDFEEALDAHHDRCIEVAVKLAAILNNRGCPVTVYTVQEALAAVLPGSPERPDPAAFDLTADDVAGLA